MKHLSKRLTLTFLLGLIFLTACGGDTVDGDVVDFYSDKADEEVLFSEISEMIYEDIEKGINYVGYADSAAFQTSIQQTLGTENAPGMFTWWSGHRLESMAESGDIVDLSDEWQEYYIELGVNPDLADAFTIDGKVYAAPYSVLYNGMFYNKEIFDKYDLSIPTTFEEFLAISDFLVSEGVTPIGTKSDPWASFLWFQQLIGAYNPDLYDELVDGVTPYTDDQVYEVMEIYLDMIESGYFGEPVDYSTLGRQFATADVAMVYEPTLFTIGLSQDYGLEPEEDYSIFIMPQMERSDHNRPIFYEAAPIVVSETSAQRDGAIEILRELYKEENHQAYADYQNSAFVEGVEVDNESSNRIIELSNREDHDIKIRYYEATPSSIVDTVTNNLWEFFYNPSDESIENTLNNIQEQADQVFGN